MGKKQIPKKTVQLSKENVYYVFAMFCIFLVLVFLASSYKVTGDDDFFWHLATGRFVVENKYVPDKDVFGYLTQNDEWIPFEWGWDVLTYGLYNVGGYNLILIFRSIVFCAIFLIFFLLMRKFKINSFIALFVLFFLLAAIMDRLSPRPHVLTYLFVVILVSITLLFKYADRDKYFKWLYAIPLMFLFWGNIHMGVLAGGLFLFIFTLSEILIYFKPRYFRNSNSEPLSKFHLQRLFIISVISAAVLLINPHGLQTYIYAYGHTKMKMLETINEWQPPFSSKLDFGFIILLYKIFIFTGFLVLIYAFAKNDLLFGLVFAGFAVYSIRAIRLTVDYEIVIAFFIAFSLNYFITGKLNKSNPVIKLLYGNPLKIVASVIIIFIISQIPNNKIYENLNYYRLFGWGINSDFLAMQLYDFMKQHDIKGRPYNHFGTGGGLVWFLPDQKNFLDSRNLNDRIFGEYSHIMAMRPGFEKKLNDYGVEYAIYLDPDLIRRPEDLKKHITAYFCTNPDWKLVFWDDKSMLFLKNIPKYAELIEKLEYKVLNPYKAIYLTKEFEETVKNNSDAVKNEINRKESTEPEGFLFNGMKEIVDKIMKNNP